ncbi:amino acid permease [Liquorilactobacillus mali]|uniref:amino acid permease n=1 Tax=Liquorilactobacillus mali TaxID=1618 RepID=UPI0029543CFB|nr:amino acid permease [Liquorilactobacillus mali]MDV7758841.1 amino acid permease [Liquorilactobacillus mali]
MKKTEINKDGTHRSLSNRHVQMIAIGGTIGTGLFLGAGTTIYKTGPSVLWIYLILGLFFFLMMRAIGEMFYSDPTQHTFVAFISRYLGDTIGCFAGWTYWLGLIFLSTAELTAIGTYVKYWFPDFSAWLIELSFLFILVVINLVAVRLFGEAEFWFAMIKIIAIVALIVTGIFMIITKTKTPLGHASINNILIGYQLFPKGIFNFITAFPMVFFAFQGIEFVSITIGEVKSPHSIIRKAVNETLVRILLFYIGSLVVIMCIIPWHALTAEKSPFVQVYRLVGIPAAAAIINFVVLTAAASALNSSIFSAGRHFYQLALEASDQSWLKKRFAHISKNGVPTRAIIVSATLVLIAPLMSLLKGINKAFTIVTGASSDLYIIVYILVLFAHRKYRISNDFLSNGFLMPAYKITSVATIIFFILVFISLFLIPADIPGAVGAIIWIAVLYSLISISGHKQI